jgi:hypothetical protein
MGSIIAVTAVLLTIKLIKHETAPIESSMRLRVLVAQRSQRMR